MTPKHIKFVPKNRKAIAPYNFVELPDSIVTVEEPLESNNCYHKNRCTGKIECVLTTDSPLYIRCGMTPENFAKFGAKSDDELRGKENEKRKALADFFQHPTTQHPVIPGSSLRGMIRTLVEIAGYGKLTKVSDEKLIYRAVGDTTSLGQKYRDYLLKKERDHSYSFLMQAGYIVEQRSGWAIRPAKSFCDEVSFARMEEKDIPDKLEKWMNSRNAYKISVQVERPKPHPHNKGQIKLNYAKTNYDPSISPNAVLVKTGSAPRKHMQFVFGMPNEEEHTLISIPEEMSESYQNQITDGQQKILGSEGVLQHMQPVFYILENDKLIFFGHAMMFRLPYEKSIRGFIPSELQDLNKRNLAESLTKPDLAEAIFGFVKNEKQEDNQARAGRVFVSDAICQKKESDDIWWTGDFTKSVTPQILAGPKPTTFQHYLVQPNSEKRDLKHYGSTPGEETVIRGHKLYWHKGNSPSIKLNNKKDVSESQTTEIKPIKPKVSFKFTLDFENLSQIELGALLWVLKIAGNPVYRLSLGMGKPLGMGAVAINYKLWVSDRTERYSSLFQDNDWATGDRLPTGDESEKYINAFENYIVTQLKKQGESYSDFNTIPRIKMLLAMLSWPGPSPEETRYMEIERDVNKPHIGQPKNGAKTVNEYQTRPVLPTPLQIMGWEDAPIVDRPRPSPRNSGGNTIEALPLKPKPKLKNTDQKPETGKSEGKSGLNLALQRPQNQK